MVQARRRQDVSAVTADVDAGPSRRLGRSTRERRMSEVPVDAVTRAHRERRGQSPVAVDE
jgi:hypothetical protein